MLTAQWQMIESDTQNQNTTETTTITNVDLQTTTITTGTNQKTEDDLIVTEESFLPQYLGSVLISGIIMIVVYKRSRDDF